MTGVSCASSVASEMGSKATAAKEANIAAAPKPERSRCPPGRRVARPRGNSLRHIMKLMIGIKAKAERKNTVCPTSTVSLTAFTHTIMPVNNTPDSNLRTIPAKGRSTNSVMTIDSLRG